MVLLPLHASSEQTSGCLMTTIVRPSPATFLNSPHFPYLASKTPCYILDPLWLIGPSTHLREGWKAAQVSFRFVDFQAPRCGVLNTFEALARPLDGQLHGERPLNKAVYLLSSNHISSRLRRSLKESDSINYERLAPIIKKILLMVNTIVMVELDSFDSSPLEFFSSCGGTS